MAGGEANGDEAGIAIGLGATDRAQLTNARAKIMPSQRCLLVIGIVFQNQNTTTVRKSSPIVVPRAGLG